MYLFRYALDALRRLRGRNLLFGGGICVLIAISFINLTLGEAAGALCAAIREEYGTQMELVELREKGQKFMTLEEYAIYAETDLVREMEVRRIVLQPNQDAYNLTEDTSVSNSEAWNVAFSMDYPNLFTRCNNPARLIEGRLPTNADEVVISDVYYAFLKEQGGLTDDGRGINMRKAVRSGEKRDEKGRLVEYEYTYTYYVLSIVGIVENDSLDLPYQELPGKNKHVMFRDYDTLLELAAENKLLQVHDSIYTHLPTDITDGYSVVYRLHDYRDIDAFAQFVEEMQHETRETVGTWSGPGGQGRLVAAQSTMPGFAQLIPPLEQMQSFSRMTVATLAVLAIATVVLMCVINMRERKYELGVLRCVGMSRGKITLTLGVECLLFLAVAAILGIAAGTGIFALSGEMLIDLTVVETAIDTVAIGVDVAKWVSLAALALAVIATTVSAGFVLRARPLAILRNRT